MGKRLAGVALAAVLLWVAGTLARTPAPSVPIATDVEITREDRPDRQARPVRQAPRTADVHMLTRVDQATLVDLPGTPPLLVPDLVDVISSADGSTLAVLRTGTPGGDVQIVEIVDTATWQVRARAEAFDGYPFEVHVLPDEEALVWVNRDDDGLRVVTAPLGEPSATSGVDVPIAVDEWVVDTEPLGDGRVGVVTFAADPLHPTVVAHVVDPARGAVRSTVVLERVPPDREVFRQLIPQVAWDVGRRRLHVVHGDDTRVTTIDLDSGAVVGEAVVAAAPPPLDRLVPATDTGGGHQGVNHQAVLSPDGRRLYVTGSQFVTITDEAGSVRYIEAGLGLAVVDVMGAQPRVLLRDDRPIGYVALSPDGRTLLARGGSYSESAAQDGGHSVQLAVLLDATTLRRRAELPAQLWPRGFSPDSTIAYADRYEDGGVPTLLAFDARTGELLGSRPTWTFAPRAGVLGTLVEAP